MTSPTPVRPLRRTWPQRLLLVLGVFLAVLCFGAARIFWDARTVLADLPRIRVGADILAQAGRPGSPLNFLLVGVDSSEGLDPDDPVRSGRDIAAEADGRFLSDTILMLRLDPATGDAAVLSIPRDLYVDVPGSSQWKINSTLLIGGMDTLIATIDVNLGIPVNHFVMVDFAGFSRLVELVDGVPVYFPYPTRDLGSGLQIDASGCWVLDGTEALAYVRARTLEESIDGEWTRLQSGPPDLARIERQQEFMVLALERALVLGGSDLGRIREFVDAGTQAVQLDELLTPGELLDLANAFSEYDTEALRVETLPVRALWSDDGRYLGEELQVVESADILRVFRGESDSRRPEDVLVTVIAADGEQRTRAVDQLVERGFRVDPTAAPVEPRRTTITFPADAADSAAILARYLEGIPGLVVGEDAAVELRIGPDFAGVRPFPRPGSDVARFLDAALARAASPDDPSTTTTTATTTSAPLATSTTTTTTVGVPKDPATGAVPPSTIERGRPPDAVRCVPTGGDG